MRTSIRVLWLSAAMLVSGAACLGAGLSSTGNTDGLLTWRLGALEAGKSAREVVLFAFDNSADGVAKRLEQARQQFKSLPKPPGAPTAKPQATVWIKNAATDFALQGPGHFFWEGARQGLTCDKGGQLSRFGWYVHYNNGADRRAGTPIARDRSVENLRMVRPITGRMNGLLVQSSKRGSLLHLR